MADEMMEIYTESHRVNFVQPSETADTSCSAFFQQQLTRLTNQLAALQTTIATVQPRQLRSPSRRRSFSRQRSPKRNSEFCWYQKNTALRTGVAHVHAYRLQLIRRTRETARPDNIGGARFRPLHNLSLPHPGSYFWLGHFSRYWSRNQRSPAIFLTKITHWVYQIVTHCGP